MKTLIFYIGLATLLAHELDAMTQSEWRLLPGLQSLPEPTAASAFVVLHMPLVSFILWLTHHPSLKIQQWARSGLAAFLIIHAGLHALLAQHPYNTFNSLLSLQLIYGGSGLGILYLVLAFMPLDAIPKKA